MNTQSVAQQLIATGIKATVLPGGRIIAKADVEEMEHVLEIAWRRTSTEDYWQDEEGKFWHLQSHGQSASKLSRCESKEMLGNYYRRAVDRVDQAIAELRDLQGLLGKGIDRNTVEEFLRRLEEFQSCDGGEAGLKPFVESNYPR